MELQNMLDPSETYDDFEPFSYINLQQSALDVDVHVHVQHGTYMVQRTQN